MRKRIVAAAAATVLAIAGLGLATAPEAQAGGYCAINSGQDWYGGWVDATCARAHRAVAFCEDGSVSRSSLGTGKRTAICWWQRVRVATVQFN